MKHGCDLCCVTCASADGLQGSSSQGTDLFRHYQQHIQEENKQTKKNKDQKNKNQTKTIKTNADQSSCLKMTLSLLNEGIRDKAVSWLPNTS